MHYTLTTPLYYVNDKPHIGSAYTTVACDAIARYTRLKGYYVRFITGVDEHGQKIQSTAESQNITPEDHVNKYSAKYRELWKEWDISHDYFVRTTSTNHSKVVNSFFQRVVDSGDIYLGRQKGWYCLGCEEYKDNNELENDPICDVHQKKLEWRDEENLFFRLSKYQSAIEKIVTNIEFIQPSSRRNEIINFVANGLKDFSISRVNVEWGIPVPGYNGHTFYVWFDALLGYLSALMSLSEVSDLSDIEKAGWPADIHVIGKDILRFHAVYWPAMLLSAGIGIPKKIFGHGFLTKEGLKMGKSLGNIIEPRELLNSYGIDSVRWYLLKDFQFGNDGDFQYRRFIDIINNDLANTIGNLLNRSISMSRKWFNDSVPNVINKNNSSSSLKVKAEEIVDRYINHMDRIELKVAAEQIVKLANEANLFLNERAPWKLIKMPENYKVVSEDIYSILETCRIIGLLLNPFLPNLSRKLLNQLGCSEHIHKWKDYLKWGILKPSSKLPEPKPVMQKIEYIEDV